MWKYVCNPRFWMITASLFAKISPLHSSGNCWKWRRICYSLGTTSLEAPGMWSIGLREHLHRKPGKTMKNHHFFSHEIWRVMRGSCKCSLKSIDWCGDVVLFLFWLCAVGVTPSRPHDQFILCISGVFQQETTIFLSQLLGATETSEFCFPGASPEGFTMWEKKAPMSLSPIV